MNLHLTAAPAAQADDFTLSPAAAQQAGVAARAALTVVAQAAQAEEGLTSCRSLGDELRRERAQHSRLQTCPPPLLTLLS